MKKLIRALRAPILLPLFLLLLAGSVSAQTNYVFMNGSSFLCNDNGTLSTTTTFGENCIWVASGTLNNNNNRNIYSYVDNTKYLNGSGANANVTLGSSASVWRNNNGLCTRSSSGWTSTYYYLYFNGATCATSSSTSTRFTPYQVTITTTDQQGNLPTITPATATIDLGGTQSFSISSSYSFTPGYTTYTFNSTSRYIIDGTSTSTTTQPTSQNCTFSSASWALSNTTYATTQTSGQTVTVTRNSVRAGENQTITLTANATYTNGGNSTPHTLTAQITIPYTLADPTAIAVQSSVNMLSNESVTIPLSYTVDGRPDNSHISVESSNPNAATGTVDATTGNLVITGVGAGTTTLSIKVNGTVMATVSVNVTGVCEPPVITISSDGLVTITTGTPSAAGATIYYTTDGSIPDATSTPYSAAFSVVNMQTINAIVIPSNSTYIASAVVSSQYFVPSGISGSTVILNDWEDIDNWTYYTGVDASVDGGNYNNNYLNKLYSPDARNIIIEYRGGGVSNASAVAISALTGENQNTMIYYQTLEKSNGAYPYTVIPNPFSKRPRTNGTSGTDGFFGFGGWKIISGGEYITGKANGNTLALDEDITFTSGLPNHATIVFEATWTAATVKTGTTAQSFTGGTYETNFWVLTGAANSGALGSLAQNMTISARYPDGTVSTTTTTSQGVSTSSSFTGKVKLEFIPFGTTTNNVSANGRNLYLGRGITGQFGQLNTVSSNMTVNQVVRVESGKFTSTQSMQLYTYGGNITTAPTRMDIYLGCDYDRAKVEGGDATYNSKLEFTQQMLGGGSNGFQTPAGTPLYKIFCKSGKFTSNFHNNLQVARYDQTFYISSNAQDINRGLRQLEIQGGEFGSIAGGRDQGTAGEPSVYIRIKGKPIIHGSIYGGASYMASNGTRTFVITGGTINGWIAGGNNGTQQDSGEGGVLKGDTYIYVGGKAKVRRENATTVINHASGGNVFGAGCGVNQTATSGSVQQGTNVVIADEADVQCGVYGGGAYAYSYEDKTSTIYITGGTVGGDVSTIAESTTWTGSVPGGVYGGAAMNKGGASKIYMTGGLVMRGIYGGSNLNGILAESAEIKVVGGQVGTAAEPAHICGGGYGQPTRITKDVDVTIGGDAVIYGEVYGGSEQGLVNTNTNASTASYQSDKHTYVNVTGGTVYGAVYGGGLGTSANAANTYGVSKVTMSAGTVNGNVFGCNNVNGRPYDATVEVEMTGGQATNVYGGGNEAAYTGAPTVTVTGSGHVTNNVFGGGKGADAKVTGNTTVIVKGSSVIDNNVYGGGHGAEVDGNTNVTIGD